MISLERRDDRVVEGTGLENRQGRKSLQGSNPCPSAMSMDVAQPPSAVDVETNSLPGITAESGFSTE
jgi:hypothetical protein